jgi:hypothetical protein
MEERTKEIELTKRDESRAKGAVLRGDSRKKA